MAYRRIAPDYYHPTHSGALLLDKTVVGYFGELHPQVVAKFYLKNKPVVFELQVDQLLSLLEQRPVKKNFDNYTCQPIKRDFSFVIEVSLEVGNLLNYIKELDKRIIDLVLFDIFPLESGKKSVGISVILQPQQPMESGAIRNWCDQLVIAVTKKFNIWLRNI
jgi:phenylalanyl-tRNA synthetase beta chain